MCRCSRSQGLAGSPGTLGRGAPASASVDHPLGTRADPGVTPRRPDARNTRGGGCGLTGHRVTGASGTSASAAGAGGADIPCSSCRRNTGSRRKRDGCCAVLHRPRPRDVTGTRRTVLRLAGAPGIPKPAHRHCGSSSNPVRASSRFHIGVQNTSGAMSGNIATEDLGLRVRAVGLHVLVPVHCPASERVPE